MLSKPERADALTGHGRRVVGREWGRGLGVYWGQSSVLQEERPGGVGQGGGGRASLVNVLLSLGEMGSFIYLYFPTIESLF